MLKKDLKQQAMLDGLVLLNGNNNNMVQQYFKNDKFIESLQNNFTKINTAFSFKCIAFLLMMCYN